VNYYQSLIQQQKEIKHKIDQLNTEYQSFEDRSDEAIPVLAAIINLRVKEVNIQEEIRIESLFFKVTKWKKTTS